VKKVDLGFVGLCMVPKGFKILSNASSIDEQYGKVIFLRLA
jgi:hypothetical protein